MPEASQIPKGSVMEIDPNKITDKDSLQTQDTHLENMDFRKGDPIGDTKQYVFEKWLGKGQCGRVFLVKDITLPDDNDNSNLKAAKIVYGTSSDLTKEYQKLSKLRHPGIVTALHIVHDKYRDYLIMDFVEGETLDAYLQRLKKRNKKPELAVTLKVAEKLAEALKFAHDNNLVHRDVSTDNIMVQINGSEVKTVKLMDFGLSVDLSRIKKSMTSNKLGAAAYRSPEGWRQRHLMSAKSDQYSLAAVIYEMLAGFYPFAGEFEDDLGLGLLVIDPNKHPKRIKGIEDYMNDALQKAMAKKPEDRFEDCEAFVEALKNHAIVNDIHCKYHEDVDVRGDLNFSLSEDVTLEMIHIPAQGYKPEFVKKLGKLKKRKIQRKLDYWIGKFPITQEQCEVILGKNPSHFKNDGKNPVENLSLEEAEQICQKLNHLLSSQLPQGYFFHIPTISQWEYACRAGGVTQLNNGEDLMIWNDGSSPNLNALGWYAMNSEGKTHPVGQKQPNAWGLFDMHGNVQEYCYKLDRKISEKEVIEFDLFGGSEFDSFICNSGDYCVKGGGYRSQASASVIEYEENLGLGNPRMNDIGLRLVLASDEVIGNICDAQKKKLKNVLIIDIILTVLCFIGGIYLGLSSVHKSFARQILGTGGIIVGCLTLDDARRLIGFKEGGHFDQFEYFRYRNEYLRLKREEGENITIWNRV